MGATATPTPSADELWQRYPLDPGPAATPRGVATPARRAAPPPGRSDSNGGMSSAVAVALLIAMSGLVLGWNLRTRTRPASGPGERPKAQGRLALPSGPSEAASRGMPPDRRRAWTAEVEWRPGSGDARFVVVAAVAGVEQRAVIAESPSLRWPPSDQAAVGALGNAVDELERALLAVGWSPRPAGAEWYAKRFAWHPRAAAGRVAAGPSRSLAAEPAPAGRFRRRGAWPPGSARLWRCEIRWSPGLANSCFEAEAYDPSSRERRRVGTSATFKWLMMSDPDPGAVEFRQELARLSARLEAAGWERIGRGPRWYSERFVWRHAGPVPETVESGDGAASGAR